MYGHRLSIPYLLVFSFQSYFTLSREYSLCSLLLTCIVDELQEASGSWNLDVSDRKLPNSEYAYFRDHSLYSYLCVAVTPSVTVTLGLSCMIMPLYHFNCYRVVLYGSTAVNDNHLGFTYEIEKERNARGQKLMHIGVTSGVPARRGLKATGAWLSMARAFKICKPSQSRQWRLALAQLWLEPWPVGVKCIINQIY